MADESQEKQQPPDIRPSPEDAKEKPEITTLADLAEDTKDRVAESLSESAEELKKAGWRPFLDAFGLYAERIVDAAQGFTDGMKGNRRRGE